MIENQSIRSLFRLHWPLLLVIVLVIPIFLLRLDRAPVSWYDEGLNINSAQTLASTGLFGLTTGIGIRLADPAIQTGVPLIALMSVVGNVFENNLLAIRLVMVLFGFLTLISLYALSYRLYGRFAALLMTLMLLAMPPTDTTSTFVWLSRQFLGEVPAILCISLGCHLLLRARSNLWTYVFVGIFWGLAIILKSQVLLILSATIAFWVLLRFATRKQDKFYWLLIAVVMFGLYGLDTLWRNSMAGSMLVDNLAVLREGIGIHILPFRALKNLRDWGVIVRLVVSVVTLGALWIFVRRTINPSPVFQQAPTVRTLQYFIGLFIAIWMFWFAFISIGWARYSFVGVVFTFIILSGVVSAVWSRIKLPANLAVYVALIVVGVLIGYIVNFNMLKATTGDDFFAMVSDIKTQIPSDARIVSLDWATDNLLPQRFVYPTTHVINVITENAFIRPNTDYEFDSLASCPQYVLLGSLRLDANILADALKVANPQPLFQHGIYKLYQVNAGQLPASCTTKP